jgi:hypothetical protein
MKTTISSLVTLAGLATTLALVGCEEKKAPAPAAGNTPAAAPAADAAKGMMDKAKESAAGAVDAAKAKADEAKAAVQAKAAETKQAVETKVDAAKTAANDALAAAKDKAVAGAQSTLDSAKAQLAEYTKKADALAAPAKMAVQPLLAQVQPQIDSFAKMIADVKSGEASQAKIDGLTSAGTKLSDLLKSVGEKLK